MTAQKLVIGVSGASGAVYAIRALTLLRAVEDVETVLIASKAAEMTLACETDLRIADLRALADHWRPIQDVAADVSSGSFRTLGMLIAPCSVKTMAEIASGVTASLLTRAADVTLKERRPLVLMLRESPLHLGHIRAMAACAEMGAVIAPPVPAFYAKPQNLEQMVDHSVGRALDLFGIDVAAVRRWSGGRAALRPTPTPEDG